MSKHENEVKVDKQSAKLDEADLENVAGGLGNPAPRKCKGCGNIVVPKIGFCPICGSDKYEYE